MVEPLAYGNHHRALLAHDLAGTDGPALVLEHYAGEEFLLLRVRKLAGQRHAVALEAALLGAFHPVDKVALVRKQDYSRGIGIQAARRLNAHRRKAVGQKFVHGPVVARVMAALEIHRLVEHHVQLLHRRDLFPIHRDVFGAFLEFHERVFQHVAIQFDKPHAHESTRFLAAAKADARK